jgi:nicotinate-nucleotide adenylyltransferase
MTSHIGIYSGTFDPVHSGHLAFANAALQDCHLDEVVFLPEQSPRGKQAASNITHRVALLEGAMASNDALRVINLASSEHFSVKETLPELRRMFKEAELTLLLGSDVLCGSLRNWADLETLLNEMSLAIALRGNETSIKLGAVMHDITTTYNVQPRYTIIQTPYPDLASSQIRGGRHNFFELHPAAASYIQQHNLYA